MRRSAPFAFQRTSADWLLGPQYPDGMFKIPTLETGSRWLVMLNGQRFVKEVSQAKDDVLSNQEFNIDVSARVLLRGLLE